MKLIADSRERSKSGRFMGFFALSASVIIFFAIPMALYFAPPRYLLPLRNVLAAEALCSFVFLIFLAAFMKSKGIISGFPMRAYDEGLLVQPSLAILPKVARYQELSSIELWFASGRSGSFVLKRDGRRFSSVEMFRDRDSLESFVQDISPSAESAGFVLESQNPDNGSFRAIFRRKRAQISLQ